jgi:hypothetical protein
MADKGGGSYMETVMPEGEAMRKAIKWISENREANREAKISKLIEEAVYKFDLSPLDADFLAGFFRKNKEQK